MGWPFYRSAFLALKHKSSNMDTLVALGTTATILYGIVMFFVGYDVEPQSHQHKMKVHEHAHHFEVSATLLGLITLGKLLEACSKQKTVKKLTDLASMNVTKGHLFTPANPDHPTLEGTEEEVQVEPLDEGDLVKVSNGGAVPTDGIVVCGIGHCNESMLTGESALQKKIEGAEVYGGAILDNGCLIIKVTRTSENSSINQIKKLNCIRVVSICY